MIKQLIEKITWYRNPVKFLRKQGMKIGKRCVISSHADFGFEPYLIELGEHVEVTNNCHFVTHDGGMWPLPDYCGGEFAADHIHKYGKITVGDNSYLGICTIVMPDVTIGKNCVIGAGSVVTKDIPDNSVACGVPARVIKSVDEYAEKCLRENLDWNHENYKKNKRDEVLRCLSCEHKDK